MGKSSRSPDEHYITPTTRTTTISCSRRGTTGMLSTEGDAEGGSDASSGVISGFGTPEYRLTLNTAELTLSLPRATPLDGYFD
jgi:hypothetical protein